MAVYESRHQPRRQTTLAGKIQNRETYDRYYDITYEALQRGIFPHMTLDVGTPLVRALNAKFDVNAARTIPPGSSLNTGNRFSGPRLDGRPGQGALYVGTAAGVLREHGHYSLLAPSASRLTPAAAPLWKPGANDRTRDFLDGQKAGAPPPKGEHFHLYRLSSALRFADLRIGSIVPLMHQLRASGEAARRYGIVDWSPIDFQVAAPSAPQDYSAARGMADAVHDLGRTTGDAGVCAYSSRADSDSGLLVGLPDDPTGGLIYAIFGRDASLVGALEPARPKASFTTFQALRAAIT